MTSALLHLSHGQDLYLLSNADIAYCLQVCPSAVGVGMLGLPGGPPSASSGRGGDAVALLAAVTAAGNVEFVTLQRGAVSPLMGTVSVSLGAKGAQLCQCNLFSDVCGSFLNPCVSFLKLNAMSLWLVPEGRVVGSYGKDLCAHNLWGMG